MEVKNIDTITHILSICKVHIFNKTKWLFRLYSNVKLARDSRSRLSAHIFLYSPRQIRFIYKFQLPKLIGVRSQTDGAQINYVYYETGTAVHVPLKGKLSASFFCLAAMCHGLRLARVYPAHTYTYHIRFVYQVSNTQM